VKVFVRTWRFGQDTTVEMHGDTVSYDVSGHLLLVGKPVLDSGKGVLLGYTITAGDEFTVECCTGCDLHIGETPYVEIVQ
jgi:hypothetical protein